MIFQIIQNSFSEAHNKGKDLSNSERSMLWIERLSDNFRRYNWTRNVCVFSKDFYGNRTEFRLNELLFDITVAEIKKIKSVSGADITVISKAIWLVESEFKKTDSRDIIIDFSKLIIGNAENKLLVVSAGSSLVEWAKTVVPNLLEDCNNNFYLASVPHPGDWYTKKQETIKIYQLSSNGWLIKKCTGFGCSVQ